MNRGALAGPDGTSMNTILQNSPGLVLVAILVHALGCSGNPSTGSDPARNGGADLDPQRIDSAEVERLRALGYVNVAPALPPDAKIGVVVHDRDRASPGLNLITNAKFCSAQLIDMEGRVHHEWSLEPCFRWGNVVLTSSGDLLVVQRLPHANTPQSASDTRFLTRLDWDGNVVWRKQMTVHHDVEQTPGDKILTLTLDLRVIPEADPVIPVRDNAIVLLDADGEILEEVSLWELLHSAPGVFTPQEGKTRTFEGGQEIDVIHANSIEWMRHPDLIGRHPIYRAESVLFCMRNQDALAIVDWETKRLLWAWGQGEISGPHDATMLPNGNILAFDNGLGRDWSRVIEVDPVEREIVWEYRAPEPESFYSAARGANQRLRNGNTLITESDSGRAFEVTPDGEIAWEFVNPNMTDKREPSVLVRVRRLEGIDYADLAERVASGRGLPFSID
jgi:hypothetical protein